MIEKMKKLTFLVYHREYEDFLHRLQDLGVMHVVTSEVNPQQSATISAYVEQIKAFTALQKDMKDLLATSKVSSPSGISSTVSSSDFLDLLDQLAPRFEHLADMRRRETEQTEQLAQLEPWGNFDPAKVKELMSAAGCEMQFYVAPTKVFNKQIVGEYPVMVVSD